MTCDYQTWRRVGSDQRRGLQLLGGAVGAGCLRTPVSATDGALASAPNALQVYMADGSRASAVVQLEIGRADEGHGGRPYSGSHYHSLAVYSAPIRQAAW